ncbi:insulinase family protein [Vibrio coralliilyticus]|uniref:insulinase family protein n=1 Tax=Vibrio coralliilyticus TaxID=190893 RepID=UPI000BAB053B|nr:insulinase family protein [Vibrio coralliilyticus]NOI56058.1 insulinase family protein [Vibrio coralliilyticus]PAT69405.1 peptidase M16 family protein [Vibrio coralliilyticus]
MSIYNRALTITLTALFTAIAALPVTAKPTSPLWFEHTDITMPRNIQASVLENGIRLVLVATPNKQQALELRLRVGAGVAQEPSYLPVSRVLANQIIGDSKWSATTDYQQTVYSLSTTGNNQQSLEGALEFIEASFSQQSFVQQAWKQSANLTDYPTVVSQNQLDSLELGKSTSPVTETSASRVQLEDLEHYFSQYYVPTNMTLVIVGDFKARTLQNKVQKAFSQWHNPTPLTKTQQPALSMDNNGISGTQGKHSVSLSALAHVSDDVDSKLMRKDLLLATIANQILEHRIESALADVHSSATVSVKNEILFNQKLLSQVLVSKIPDGEQQATKQIVEQEIKTALAVGFTHSEYEAAVSEIRLNKQAELAAFRQAGPAAMADRMVNAIDNGSVYTTPSFELELIDFHVAHLSEIDISKEFEKIWAHRLKNI